MYSRYSNVKSFIDFLDYAFLTGDEFNQYLEEFLDQQFHGAVKVYYELKDKDKEVYEFGSKGEGANSYSKNVNYRDGYSVEIELWAKNEEISIESCKTIFSTYWNSWYNNDTCGLPSASQIEVVKKIENTVSRWKSDECNIAFIMIDLDHFKKVNDTHDHETGTRVISEYSRLLYRHLYRTCIIIHQSGDEFNVLTRDNNAVEILNRVYLLKKVISSHRFLDAKELELTMACGAWINGDERKYYDIRNKAEEAYNPNGVKQRNSIRFYSKRTVKVQEENVRLSIARLIGNLSKHYLFHNIYLDYIAELTRIVENLGDIQHEVDGFLDWVTFDCLDNSYQRCPICTNTIDFDHRVSRLDIGLAVLQGVLNNNRINGSSISFSIQNGTLVIKANNNSIFQLTSLMIGDFEWSINNFKSISQEVDVRNTILVQPGYNSVIGVPMDIFYAVVPVDERPTIGGGLPDFWAAAMASLINCTEENPNVNSVVLNSNNGNINRIRYYLEKLSNLGDDDIDYLSKKTYKTETSIRRFISAVKDNIHVINEPQELIMHVFDSCSQLKYEKKKSITEISPSQFLVRSLSDESIALQICDGCRTNSLAQAFPIVLELLRKNPATHKINKEPLELKELIAFKVVLSTPLNDVLPIYYGYDKDKHELEEYYNKNFVDENGLFRKRLIRNNQLNNMIKHVTNTINNGDYSTRRALLVVDNDSSSSSNYSPLGLVSIWLAPRWKEERIIIDYCYTWRTVEAIVGFPFSMYASIKYSEWLNTEIKKSVISEKQPIIEMGSLTYFAYSLHMYTNKENMSIARGIVNEVSI